MPPRILMIACALFALFVAVYALAYGGLAQIADGDWGTTVGIGLWSAGLAALVAGIWSRFSRVPWSSKRLTVTMFLVGSFLFLMALNGGHS